MSLCCFAAFCGRDKFVNGPIFENEKKILQQMKSDDAFINE